MIIKVQQRLIMCMVGYRSWTAVGFKELFGYFYDVAHVVVLTIVLKLTTKNQMI